jgi:glycosyltransferase involved in cell wall biosynthesis
MFLEPFSIIVPVFNRREELKRCLKSLKNQSFPSFEVLIIDDASTIPIKDVVDEINDPRFKYIRNKKNGGPYNARTTGWENCSGEYIINIDSDWEAFPWMIERAKYYLDSHPEAASITGMHLRYNDSRMFVRVRDGERLVTPEDAAKLNPVPDCVGATRRHVIEEWLNKSHDYFALEAHSWLTFSLKHAQLYVDEPWTLYHINSPNSATLTISGRSSQRVNDCLLFLDDHDQILKEVHRRDVDLMLDGVIFVLLRNYHWRGFKKAFNYLRLRSTNPKKDLLRIIINRVDKKLVSCFSRKNQNKVFWV